jgi:hypothetical protein
MNGSLLISRILRGKHCGGKSNACAVPTRYRVCCSTMNADNLVIGKLSTVWPTSILIVVESEI